MEAKGGEGRMTELKPLKMGKVYALCVKAGLLKEAEFIEGFIIKQKVIDKKEKRGTRKNKG